MQHNAQRTPRPRADRGPESKGDDFYVTHDPESAATLSATVAHALADVMGMDVTETEFSLYDAVDPDALDKLFSPREDGKERSLGHVAFDVQGYKVTVYSNGEIVITPPTPVQ